MVDKLKRDLIKIADPKRATVLQRFFKTGQGEYGEGDKFIGLTLPQIREAAKIYKNLRFEEIQELLSNPVHEFRTIALVILKAQYKKAENKKPFFDFYLKNTRNINNWDLVDISAPNIVGDYLLTHNRSILFKLVKSKTLWERRVAVLATFAFIKDGDFNDSLKLAEILLSDKQDLMHKAVGWMLREIGKKDLKTLEKFLDKNAVVMPRTMLRYAIEKFSEEKRKHYLSFR